MIWLGNMTETESHSKMPSVRNYNNSNNRLRHGLSAGQLVRLGS